MLSEYTWKMILYDSEIVNIHETKIHLSRLLERAHAGEGIILAKDGKPYASQQRPPALIGG